VNTFASCPDALLVQARIGTMSTADRARLDAHLGRCEACRVTLSVGKAFDASLGARAGDDEIARRIADRVVVRPRRRRWPVLIAAAAVLLTGSVAAANAPAVWRAVVEWVGPAPDPIVAVPATVEAPPVGPVARPSAPTIESEAIESEAVESEAVEPTQAPSLAPPPVVPAQQPRAAQLFAEGNASRRQGDASGARKAYQKLQRLFPGSVEAVVSYVSLGRLERSANPGAALRHFNAYLGQSSHRTLAEEALFGKASCLAALGRSLDERTTWSELLRRFPNSVYAPRARARLSDPNAE
jgi:tetratricopeptide (TPR) repeat protein